MVDLADHYGNFLTHSNVIGKVAQVFVANQSVLPARRQLNEHAEVGRPCDFAGNDVSHLGITGQAVNPAAGQLDHRLVAGRNNHRAIVRHVDSATGLFLDGTNYPASRANESANLLNRNLHPHQLGRVLAHLVPGLRDSFRHAVQDVQPTHPGLLQRLTQKLLSQSINFHVHLQGVDSLFRAGNLEVHVAEEVLDALNVAEDGILPISGVGDQAHRNTGHGRLKGHTRIHQCH